MRIVANDVRYVFAYRAVARNNLPGSNTNTRLTFLVGDSYVTKKMVFEIVLSGERLD